MVCRTGAVFSRRGRISECRKKVGLVVEPKQLQKMKQNYHFAATKSSFPGINAAVNGFFI